MSAMASQITSLTIVYSTVLFRHRSKKTWKLRVTGLCEGNSSVTVEFPTQKTSNTEHVSIWWRHHAMTQFWPTKAYIQGMLRVDVSRIYNEECWKNSRADGVLFTLCVMLSYLSVWNMHVSRVNIICTWSLVFRFVVVIHYTDVIMGSMASQITSLTIVFSTVYPGTDQRKYQRWISRTNGQ